MKLFQQIIFGFLISLSFSMNAQQVPDFTVTDLNGNEHKLYEDYLDQGKPVFISFFTVWNVWDLAWLNQGVMDEFYALYGPNGTDAAQILFLECDEFSDDAALFGNSPSSQGDFVTGHDFPIINHPNPQEIIDLFGIIYFPYVAVICPDGTVFSSESHDSYVVADSLMFYGELGTPELMAERSFQNCGVNLLTQFLGGSTYIDTNNNCDNDAEVGAPEVMINISNGTDSYTRVSNAAGDYIFPAGDHVYSVSAVPPSPSWQICNPSETADFPGTGQSEIYIDFGLEAANACPYPTIDISAPFLRRCFENVIHIPYCNNGSVTLENAVIHVELDEAFIFLNSSVAPTTQNGQNLSFEVGDVDVFDCGEIIIWFEVDCESELGDLHCYEALINADNLCGGSSGPDVGPASAYECQENIGAFDPNDKRSFPRGEGDDHAVLPETPLKYQIRFQNTGTDTAFNIVVLDTLTELLDLETFRPGASSHPYEWEITEERTLKFLFENIMLPDSNVNLEASNGFVNFFINHVEGLPEGTVISNRAAIYFDFNEPVITEDTWITLLTPNAVKNPTAELDFSVNPNPTTDAVFVNLGQHNISTGTWNIYHPNGQILMEGAFGFNQFAVDVEKLLDGVYILQVIDSEGNVGNQRIVKY